jgi:hypothetical protein
LAAKLVVTASKGGSRISLVGTSGTELLGSKIFDEPRAKGATLRSLKSLLGEDIVVEDYTLSDGRASRLAKASNTPTAAPEPAVDTVAAEAPKPQARRASKAGNSAKSSRKGPVKSAAKSPATAPSKTAPKVTAKAVGRARKQAAK